MKSWYNEFPHRDGKGPSSSYRHTHPTPATEEALEEIAGVETWADFVRLCEKQEQLRQGKKSRYYVATPIRCWNTISDEESP